MGSTKCVTSCNCAKTQHLRSCTIHSGIKIATWVLGVFPLGQMLYFVVLKFQSLCFRHNAYTPIFKFQNWIQQLLSVGNRLKTLDFESHSLCQNCPGLTAISVKAAMGTDGSEDDWAWLFSYRTLQEHLWTDLINRLWFAEPVSGLY